jgi:hypothetical protein
MMMIDGARRCSLGGSDRVRQTLPVATDKIPLCQQPDFGRPSVPWTVVTIANAIGGRGALLTR